MLVPGRRVLDGTTIEQSVALKDIHLTSPGTMGEKSK
jgi:hypothetical protein